MIGSRANCIVGSTGFVGTTLLSQANFGGKFSSKDIEEIRNTTWGTVVCAAAPAQKWLANKEPELDFLNIKMLLRNLETIKADRFILVSTVDVFETPVDVTENSAVGDNVSAYGRNRFWLEQQVRNSFERATIARLPGLVGEGLRKNVIFDFKHRNNLELIDSRSSFQFYPMVNLWRDLQIAARSNLELVHLTAAPIKTSRVAELAGFVGFEGEGAAEPISYDFQTIHAGLWETQGNYQYSLSDSEHAISRYFERDGES